MKNRFMEWVVVPVGIVLAFVCILAVAGWIKLEDLGRKSAVLHNLGEAFLLSAGMCVALALFMFLVLNEYVIEPLDRVAPDLH